MCGGRYDDYFKYCIAIIIPYYYITVHTKENYQYKKMSEILQFFGKDHATKTINILRTPKSPIHSGFCKIIAFSFVISRFKMTLIM